MALLGIDIGDHSCFVGAAIGGGIEIITNDVTDRLTPSIVSFRAKDRQIGACAKSQTIVNYKNTISGIKNLLGRDYLDPIVQNELAKLPFSIGQYPNSSKVGILVNYMGSERWFTPTQILSMLLGHIAVNAQKTLNTKILSTVISVPSHFTDIQRRAVVDATKLAGLPLQQLINDGNAIALTYGIYKKDLPEKEQPPRNVAFVDFGHTSFQLSIYAFSNGKAKCLSCISYPNLGGRDFDVRLFNHFAAQFNQKYKVDIQENKKSCLKLLAECEKLKRLLSANVTSIPINIECLMEDFDFTFRMNREEFEKLCEDLLLRIESASQEALLLSKLHLKDLFSVELVGGSSRLPAVSRIVQSIFSKEAGKTLNLDESVAKGCALQSALLSSTIRIKQFKVVGVIPYAIHIKWTDTETGDKGEMEAFKAGSPSNVSKVIPFTRKSDFQIECSYKDVDNTLHQNPIIIVFTIKKVKPTEEGHASEIKVKFRVDNSGLLTIPRVDLIEKRMVEVKEEDKPNLKPPQDDVNPKKSEEKTISDIAKDETQASTGDKPAENETEISGVVKQTQVEAESAPKQESCLPLTEKMDTLQETETVLTPLPKQFKEVINKIELPVVVDARSMTKKDFEEAQNIESELLSQDRYQAEKANSKNALEEYIYEMRDKIETSLKEYFHEQDKDKIRTNLEKMDEWLMNDETEEPSVYKDHLNTLKEQCEPGIMRSIQFQERPVALDQLGHSIVRCSKFVAEYRSGSEEYQHIETEEVVKVENIVKEKRTWLEEQLQIQQNLDKFDSPTVTAAQIISMNKQLSDSFLPIMSKPKPKPKEEPPKDVKDPNGDSISVPSEQTASDTKTEVDSKDTQETTPPEQKMELD